MEYAAMVTTVNDIELYIWKLAKRIGLKSFHD